MKTEYYRLIGCQQEDWHRVWLVDPVGLEEPGVEPVAVDVLGTIMCQIRYDDKSYTIKTVELHEEEAIVPEDPNTRCLRICTALHADPA
jgi:hypothetical protein